jgi:putative ABC transport system substrate-binding protein
MNRREFIAGLGSVVALPVMTRAQQPSTPVVGFLHSSTPDSYAPFVEAFYAGLNEMGFVHDRNMAIEFRWAENHPERLPALAAELVGRRVAVIAAGATPATLAARAATASIPIVFTGGADPVKNGLAASFNRPGGNVTGVLQFTDVLITKRFELLHELAPKATVVGLLVDPETPNATTAPLDVHTAARAIGLQSHVFAVTTIEQFDAVFAAIVKAGVNALLVSNAPIFTSGREQLAALAARYAIPASYEFREFVHAGGLMSYGSSNSQGYRQVGVYVGRILKGEKPADLPIMQPTRFELAINMRTAKALGLTVPQSILLRADEVIE